MDVTRINFELIVDDFISLLNTCDFYAMDQEMTGISIAELPDQPAMELADSYPGKKAAAERYIAFQVGICLFHKTAEGSYEARPFNFFLRKGNSGDDIVLNMSALDFLCANHMNFQKWIYEGLPYVDAAGEAVSRAFWFPPDTSSALQEKDKAWLASFLCKVKGWSDTQQSRAEGTAAAVLETTDAHRNVDCDIALHHEIMRLNLPIVADPPLDSRIPPYKRVKTTFKLVTPEEAAASVAQLNKRREAAHFKRIGFRRIFTALVNSKKPIIGHNFISDMMFFLNQSEGPLPATHAEFHELSHRLFPFIIDTKVLSTCVPSGVTAFVSTALEPLFIELNKRAAASTAPPVKIKLPLGFESYNDSAIRAAAQCNSPSVCAHQAAYDAYMTGCAFLIMQQLFGEAHVRLNTNIIAVFGSLFFMNLRDGEDPQVFANCSAYLLTFPDAMLESDLEVLFWTEQEKKAFTDAKEKPKTPAVSKPVDPRPPGMRLRWVDDTTAVMVIYPPRNDSDVLSLVKSNIDAALALNKESNAKDVVVCSFSEYLENVKAGKQLPAGKKARKTA